MAKFIIRTVGVLLFLMVFGANSSIIKSTDEDDNNFLANFHAEQIFKKLLANLRQQNNGEMKRAHFWKRSEDFNLLNKDDENEAFTISDSDEIKKRAHFWKRYQNFNSLRKNDEDEVFTVSDNDDIRKRAHFW